MDGTDPADETWEAWSARVARELEQLGPDGWLTFVVHVHSAAVVAQERREARRGWRRAFAPPPPPRPVPDVFLQARPIEGLLALECIADAEFEGVTDLTARQLETLAALGWEPDADDPVLSATFDVSEAADAADLIAASLRGVLGAESPGRVDLRRST